MRFERETGKKGISERLVLLPSAKYGSFIVQCAEKTDRVVGSIGVVGVSIDTIKALQDGSMKANALFDIPDNGVTTPKSEGVSLVATVENDGSAPCTVVEVESFVEVIPGTPQNQHGLTVQHSL